MGMVIFVLLIIIFLQMYRIYKAVYDITTEQNKTWEECCLRVPVVNIDKMIEEELEGKRRRREADDEWDFSDFEQEEFVEKTDMSVDNYPEPYCGKVADLPTQCYQESLLELWAVEGATHTKRRSKLSFFVEHIYRKQMLSKNEASNFYSDLSR